MGEWKKIKMGQYVDIKHGFAFKGEFFTDSSTTDLLLTPGNFAIGGGFQWGKKKYYRGPISDEFVLYPGDIIVTMTDLSKEADTLGYSAIVPKSNFQLLHNQRIGKILIKSPDIDSRYLHWQMRTPGYRNEVLASASGSTVKHTSPSKILNYEFCLPSIHEQQAIAAILGSLDDKIDLNRRMNETLEAMARAVFKDWFVDFGPTRAKMEGRAPYLAQEIWDLFPDALDDEGKPVGWQVSSIGQCFNLTMGQSPPGDTYNDHEEGLPFFQGRTDFGFRYPENRKYCSSPSRCTQPGGHGSYRNRCSSTSPG